MSKKLDNALGLYMEGIRDGKVREAVTKYTGARYTQHSTGVADGVEGFVAFFDAFVQRVPVRDIRVVRAIEDERYVFCHVVQSLNDGESCWITTDLFDTDADDKIVEHWDVISAWTDDAQWDGATEVQELAHQAANKELVASFASRVLIGGERDGLDTFCHEDLVQHEIGVGDGAAVWMQCLDAPERSVRYREVFRLIGQGNFLVTYCKVDVGGRAHAIFDIYRLADGRIAERWTNAEVVPEDTGNSGKF